MGEIRIMQWIGSLRRSIFSGNKINETSEVFKTSEVFSKPEVNLRNFYSSTLLFLERVV